MLVIAATPASLEAIPPRRASVELIGPPSDDELDHLRTIVTQYADSGTRLLVDLRSDQTTDLPRENIKAFATFLASLKREGLRRVSVLAGTQPAHYGLARMMATYIGLAGIEVACFHDADDAMGWVRQ